ncbi:MAG: hypothetical protein IPF92_28560 [Myxococcales bacterium]|nr:hypothetical protein [Myxococcales bacterium]
MLMYDEYDRNTEMGNPWLFGGGVFFTVVGALASGLGVVAWGSGGGNVNTGALGALFFVPGFASLAGGVTMMAFGGRRALREPTPASGAPRRTTDRSTLTVSPAGLGLRGTF